MIQSTNIAVPGLQVSNALTLRPSLTAAPGPGQWATLVLGFPSLFQGVAPTELELAASLKPTTVIEWLGNNDALVPALFGQLSGLTPLGEFATDYKGILDSLQSQTGATIVTATIPDVTEIAFFTPVAVVAQNAGLPLSTVTSLLGVGRRDYIRSGAQSYVNAILTGSAEGPLPAACPAPFATLGVASTPCVLTQSDAQLVSSTINCYNLIITTESLLHGATVVDIHGLVDRIYTHGVELQGKRLTTGFLGGLFSLDGIHPTNTGYGVIANEFIDTMNRAFGTQIPEANLEAIFEADPLAKFVSGNNPVRNSIPAPSSACLLP